MSKSAFKRVSGGQNIPSVCCKRRCPAGQAEKVGCARLPLAPPAFAVGHLHFRKNALAITSKWVLAGFNGVLVIPKLPEYLHLYITLFIKRLFIYRYNLIVAYVDRGLYWYGVIPILTHPANTPCCLTSGDSLAGNGYTRTRPVP